jgi:hypothetical protein
MQDQDPALTDLENLEACYGVLLRHPTRTRGIPPGVLSNLWLATLAAGPLGPMDQMRLYWQLVGVVRGYNDVNRISP